MSKPKPTNNLTRAEHQRIAYQQIILAVNKTAQEWQENEHAEYSEPDNQRILHWINDVADALERRANRIGTL